MNFKNVNGPSRAKLYNLKMRGVVLERDFARVSDRDQSLLSTLPTHLGIFARP